MNIEIGHMVRHKITGFTGLVVAKSGKLVRGGIPTGRLVYFNKIDGQSFTVTVATASGCGNGVHELTAPLDEFDVLSKPGPAS